MICWAWRESLGANLQNAIKSDDLLAVAAAAAEGDVAGRAIAINRTNEIKSHRVHPASPTNFSYFTVYNVSHFCIEFTIWYRPNVTNTMRTTLTTIVTHSLHDPVNFLAEVDQFPDLVLPDEAVVVFGQLIDELLPLLHQHVDPQQRGHLATCSFLTICPHSADFAVFQLVH